MTAGWNPIKIARIITIKITVKGDRTKLLIESGRLMHRSHDINKPPTENDDAAST